MRLIIYDVIINGDNVSSWCSWKCSRYDDKLQYASRCNRRRLAAGASTDKTAKSLREQPELRSGFLSREQFSSNSSDIITATARKATMMMMMMGGGGGDGRLISFGDIPLCCVVVPLAKEGVNRRWRKKVVCVQKRVTASKPLCPPSGTT